MAGSGLRFYPYSRLSADGHKYDDVCCVAFGLGLGARRAQPPSGAATDEQRRPRPKATQPSGRPSFLAQASWLAPYRPTKGMLVAHASPQTSSYLCSSALSFAGPLLFVSFTGAIICIIPILSIEFIKFIESVI